MISEVEPVLRLALQFLDLSRDLERNRDDAAFRAGGGTIHYVFDANIFEIFMRPTDPRAEQASLHAPSWPKGRTVLDDRARAALTAQTALLTSEFLLSEELSAWRADAVLLSEWHSWEFARRVKSLMQSSRPITDRAKAVAQYQEIARILEHYYSSKTPVAAARPSETRDRVLDDDLRDIERTQPLSPSDRRAFAINRLLLKWLADRRNSAQPADQLLRLLSEPISRRFLIVHERFAPSDAAREHMKADASLWFDRLVSACRARHIPIDADEEAGRSLAALWDDARSLALVRWAAGNAAEPGQRIVMVTADALLFDTYRLWYVDRPPASPEFSEPFVLRRPIQFAPILNMSEARNSLGDDVRAFFQRLQAALEVTLLPINLSYPREGDPRAPIISRMREKTALRLLDAAERPISTDIAYQPLIQDLLAQGVDRYRLEFENLLEDWRRLERVTLGVADAYVERRLTKLEADIPGISGGQVSHEAITRYLDHLIQGLYDGSIDLWMPLARQTIADWLAAPTPKRRRAPIAFRFLPGSDQLFDGADDDEPNSDRSERIAEAVRRAEKSTPEEVFAIAACVALASEDWSNADHFADMALQGATIGPSGNASRVVAAPRLYEVKYLNALTRRFRIGMLGPVRNSDVLVRVRGLYGSAAELLDDCIEHHRQNGRDQRQSLRYLRAISERVALNLFCAAALSRNLRGRISNRKSRSQNSSASTFRSGGFDLDVSAQVQAEAAQRLVAAIEGLDECWNAITISRVEGIARVSALDQLREQVAVNTAAAVVIRDLAVPLDAPSEPTIPEIWLDKLTASARGLWLENASARSPLLAAELLAFLRLRGDPRAAEDLAKLRRRQPPRWTLGLDAALYSLIVEGR